MADAFLTMVCAQINLTECKRSEKPRIRDQPQLFLSATFVQNAIYLSQDILQFNFSCIFFYFLMSVRCNNFLSFSILLENFLIRCYTRDAMISGLRQPRRKCCFTKSGRAEISTLGIFVHGADEIGICRICGCSALRYGVTDIRIFQYSK